MECKFNLKVQLLLRVDLEGVGTEKVMDTLPICPRKVIHSPLAFFFRVKLQNQYHFAHIYNEIDQFQNVVRMKEEF